MEGTFVKFILVSAVWTTLLLSSKAESPICNTQPTGLFGYGQFCINSSQCVTDFCSNSICSCSNGTTYSTCAVACVADCQTTVNATSGTITSPGYPMSSTTTYCTWTIQGSQGTIIAFNITYMDVGLDNNCSSGYLEIFDGPSPINQPLVNTCTTSQTLTLSTTNYMHVVFRTSGSGIFLASFKGLGKQITLSEPKGFIASPGYPLSYVYNMFYTWTIQGNADTYIVLNITDFLFECYFIFGYLTIYDGPTNAASLFGTSCSSSLPGVMASTSNYMFIEFKINGYGTYAGFYGNYEIRDLNDVLNATTGTITNTGNTSSSSATNNTWTIRGPTGTIIAFNIAFIDMSTNNSCAADYIEIYDGPSTLSRSFGKMCTDRQILTLSTKNCMHVVFRTLGNGTFLATYSILDTNITLTDPKGFISSPGYPLGFLIKKFYTWTIQGKPDTVILLNLIESNLDDWSCYYNKLKIYDGPTANSSCLDSCVNSPRLIISTHNYLHMVLNNTSYPLNFRGFYGNYEIRDLNDVLNATTGTITNAENTSSSSSTNKAWTIRGPTGTIIAFNITHMDMGTNYSCAADYIEIFDGPWTLSRSFGKMCTARQILTLSTTNFMHVVFRTLRNGKFLATYKVLDTHITLTEPQGFISSPGYPLGYLNYMFYTWTIRGNPDTFITLNITDFLLKRYCSYDYLKIYDGPTNASSLFGNFCSTFSPGFLASTSNYMFLEFKIDFIVIFRGFYGNYMIREKTHGMGCNTNEECPKPYVCRNVAITANKYCLCDKNYYRTFTNSCIPISDLQVKDVQLNSRTSSSLSFNWTFSNVQTTSIVTFTILTNDGKNSTGTISGGTISLLNAGTQYNCTVMSIVKGDNMYTSQYTSVTFGPLWTTNTYAGSCSNSTSDCVAGTMCIQPFTTANSLCLCNSSQTYATDNFTCLPLSNLQVQNLQWTTGTHSINFTWLTTHVVRANATYAIIDTSSSNTLAKASSDATGASLTNLVPGTKYSLMIRCELLTDSYYNNMSYNIDISDIITYPSMPGKVYNVTQLPNTAINGPFEYIIYFNASEGNVASYILVIQNSNIIIDTLISSTNFVVSKKLTPARIYLYEITAQNTVGNMSEKTTGRFSTSSIPSGVPSYMQIPVESITAYTAIVTWQMPKNPNGNITGYVLYVTYRRESCLHVYSVGCNDCSLQNLETPNTCKQLDVIWKNYTFIELNSQGYTISVKISSLDPYTNYTVVVLPYSDAGQGTQESQSFATRIANEESNYTELAIGLGLGLPCIIIISIVAAICIKLRLQNKKLDDKKKQETPYNTLNRAFQDDHLYGASNDKITPVISETELDSQQSCNEDVYEEIPDYNSYPVISETELDSQQSCNEDVYEEIPDYNSYPVESFEIYQNVKAAVKRK